MTRTTISFSEDTLNDLDYLASRLGVTRSALVNSMLSDTVSDLRQLVEEVQENPTQDDLKRFRGKSADIVNQRVHRLRQQVDNDLFDNM